MKIIDGHIHIHSLPGHPWDSPPERVLPLLDRASIEKAVIMPYGEVTPQDPSLLEYTIQCVEKYPQRLIGFARMDPAGEEKGIDLFEESVKSGAIQGLKFHPLGTMIHPADPRTIAFVEKAAALGVPVLFHCGDEEWTLPYQIGQLASQVPEAQIILGHMGGYFHTDQAIEVARQHSNCYLETSATPHPQTIARALEAVGPDRIIFGSDGPGCFPTLEVKKIKILELEREWEEKIFHKNLSRLLPGG